MYELLNFSVDIPSTSAVEHQPQFDNTSYIKMTSFHHDTNVSDQVKDPQHEQQSPKSISPNIPISDNSHQPQFNSINHVLMESHQDANILNQQYQLNIPNDTLADAVVNFMSNNSNQNQQNVQKNVNEIFPNHSIDQAKQIDNDDANTVNDDVILDSFSSMSISSGLVDSQFAVEMCGDFIKHLDNNGGETIVANNNQSYLPNTNEQIMNFCIR